MHLFHVGSEASFHLAQMTLKIDGQGVDWAEVDENNRMLTASYEVPLDTPELTIQLNQDGSEVNSWRRTVGYGLDPIDGYYDLYPAQTFDPQLATLGWQVHLCAPPGMMDNDVLSQLILTKEDGTEVKSTQAFLFGRRDRLTVSAAWEDLTGLNTVLVRDHQGGWTLSLPVDQPANEEALVAQIDEVTCGLSHSRLRVGNDRSFGALAPLDAQGDILGVSASSLALRVEGGEVVMALRRAGELWDLGFAVAPSEATGSGRIIVEDLGGRVLGECAFETTEWADQSDDVATHWAVLSKESIDLSAEDPTTRLRIGLLNDYNELLGAAASPTVLLNGGTWTDDIAMTDAGTYAGNIAPAPTADTITITITLAGRVLETLVVPVAGATSDPSTPSTPEAPEPGDEGGCAGHSPSQAHWLMLGLLGLTAWRRRTERLRLDA